MSILDYVKRWLPGPIASGGRAPKGIWGASRLWGSRQVIGDNTTNVSVNHDAAMSLPVVFGCVNAICSGLAPLPLRIVQRMADGSIRQAREHPAHQLLTRSMDGGNSTPSDFRRSMLLHALVWGTASIEIIRAGDGSMRLELLDPNLVQPLVDGDGRLSLTVGGVPVDREKIIRINALGFSPLGGFSPVLLARQAFAIALAADRTAGSTLSNSQMASGFLKAQAQMTPEAASEMLDSFVAMGSGLNSGGVGYIPFGVDFEKNEVDPARAQLLESRKHQVIEICRLFNVPPSKVFAYEGFSYGSAEAANLDFITGCLNPWAETIEQAFALRLLTADEQADGYFFAHDFKQLMRGDSTSRANYFEKLNRMGVLSANQVAVEEGYPTFEGGDQHLVQLNLAPADDPNPADDGQRLVTLSEGKSNGV